MAYTDKEIWKQIPFPKGSTTKNYAISSHGRIASFTDSISDLYILQQHAHEGYHSCSIRKSGRSIALFPHNLIGNLFLKKPSSKHFRVIHIDHNKSNNHISNLKWVTKAEFSAHNKTSPAVIQAIKTRVYTGNHAKKLDEKKVIQLKKEIFNPKRKLTLKQLANKFGIAEMNLYRIKNGELWYYVRVEGEPMNDNYKRHLRNVEFQKKKEAKEKIAKEKKEKIQAAKLKARLEAKKKKEAEKKARLEERLKKRKEKALKKLAKSKLKPKKVVKKVAKKVAKPAKKTATPKNYTLVKITKKAKKKK